MRIGGAAAAACVAAGTAAGAELVELSGGALLAAYDPRVVDVAVAGAAPAAAVVRGCPGFLGAAPAVRVEMTAAVRALRIYLEGPDFAAVLVEGPDGVARCAPADAAGVAMVGFERPLDGAYAIWPAAASQGATAEGIVALGERELIALEPDEFAAMPPRPSALATDAEPAHGRHVLPEGEGLELFFAVGGDVSASIAADGSCSGAIDPGRPDAIVTLTAAEPELHFAGDSQTDTTLVVVDPNGLIHCDDDTFGHDPAVAIMDAPAGDYAVWIGVWGGGRADAYLIVGRTPDAPEQDDADSGSARPEAADAPPNPFLGRDLPSAVAALDVLLEQAPPGAGLQYARLRETGPEGFVLEDVLLFSPEGGEPMRVGRIVVDQLDLAGLSAHGAPQRFAISLHDIDYASMAEAARSADGPPLPALQDAPPMSLALSLLPPDGDMTRRTAAFGLDLGRLFGLSLTAALDWPEGADGPPDPDAILTDALRVELRDGGYVAAMADAMAAADGRPRDALVAEARGLLAMALEPTGGDAPRDRLFGALMARLEALDQPGTLRLDLRADRPTDLQTLFGALEAGAGEGLLFEAAFTPDD